MAEVQETRLPGVGVRHDFTTGDGQEISVLVHRDGRREILVYDASDRDVCTSMVSLSADDTRTMSELLGVSQVTEAIATVQQDIEGLAIEWIQLDDDSPASGLSIGDGQYRTRTGASIVAIMRGATPVPAPGPEFLLEKDDVVVAVGTTDGLATLRALLRT